jgi:hypothetical protein
MQLLEVGLDGGPVAKPESQMSLSAAVASGDRVASLRALRDVLASNIEAAEAPRDVAPLARQLTLVLAELDALAPPERKGTHLDQLADRRRARGAATASVDEATRAT